MAITLKSGSVGEGKSATAIGDCLDHLRTGGVVATNFGLSDNWPQFATRGSVWDHFDKDARRKREYDMWSRWFRIGSVDSINEVGEQLPDLVSGQQRRRLLGHRLKRRKGIPEGLGLLILDEGHIFFNSRDWRDNMPLIHFLSQSRKKGWHVVIIAHDPDMIDSQIRKGLINFEESMRNLANCKPLPFLPRLGFFTLGIPFFLGITRYSGKGGGKGMIHGRSLRFLTSDVANVYETMEQFDYTVIQKTAERIGLPPALPGVGQTPSPELRKTLEEMAAQFNGTDNDDPDGTPETPPLSQGRVLPVPVRDLWDQSTPAAAHGHI